VLFRSVIVESDHGVLCESEKKLLRGESDSMETDELPVEQFGLLRASNETGKWASCIRLINPFQGDTLSKFELDFNEAAFCVCILSFNTDPGVTYAVVGTARDVILSPRSCTSGFLRTYKFIEEGQALELHHVTPIDGVPTCLCAFQGRLLVGLGNALRIYEIGKKKMLRKCESRIFPNLITQIQTIQDRVIVTDIQEGAFFCRYLSQENRLVSFADESVPRWMTCFCMLDYDTMVGGDKFGNVFVCRVPEGVADEADDDPTGSRVISERSFLNGAYHKLQHLCEFYVGESITSIHRTVLVPGGREVILYTTILGTVGILVPFTTKEDIEFFQSLEIHMRKESPSATGRDHLSYRSMYMPVRCVIDGDLCEQYASLSGEKKREIAETLDRTVAEVGKKLEDARVRVAF